MASRERPAGGYSRRFAWLAAAIVAVVVLYTVGWFYMAGLLQNEAEETLSRIERGGGVALCANREARGYPFRIGLFCDEIGITDAGGQVEVTGQGLRTAAQIYDPFRIVGELDTLRLVYPGRDPGYSASASDLRFSASVAQPLPDRASMAMRGVSLDSDPQAGGLPVAARAETMQVHMRRNSGDVDVAMEALDVTVTPAGTAGAVAVSRIGFDLTVENGIRRLERPGDSLRGMSFVLRNASVSLGEEAGVTVSGPVAVGNDGLVDASLQIVVNEPAAVAARLSEALPAQKDNIRAAMTGFAALGDSPSLPLTIRKGVARIGFITLGKVPPVE